MASTSDTVTALKAREASRLRILLRKCFSFPVMMGAMLVALDCLVLLSFFRVEPDTWWHIKIGEDILATHTWPTSDAYSFTAYGAPRLAFEWGGEVVLALAWRLGGLRGLEAFLLVVTSTIVLLTYRYACVRSQNSKAAFVASAVTFPLLFLCFTARPQLLGYIFLLVTLICLERFRLGRQKTLWLLPPLFLVWVNTHPSFSLGFMVLGVYWASGLRDFSLGSIRADCWRPAQRLHLELVGLLSLLVLPLTPYGARLAATPLEVASSFPLSWARIQEWQSLDFGLWQAKLLFVLLFAFLVAQVTLQPTYRLEELALLLFAACSVFLHLRFMILFGLIFAPLLATLLARWVPAYQPAIDKYALNAIIMLAVVAVVVRQAHSEAELSEKMSAENPVKAVEYLRRHPASGPMFNTYGFGGYLFWKLGPEHRVFIDGRSELYESTGVLYHYLRISDLAPEAPALLSSYHIQSCLLQRREPLATLLAASPDWRQVYADRMAILFVKK